MLMKLVPTTKHHRFAFLPSCHLSAQYIDSSPFYHVCHLPTFPNNFSNIKSAYPHIRFYRPSLLPLLLCSLTTSSLSIFSIATLTNSSILFTVILFAHIYSDDHFYRGPRQIWYSIVSFAYHSFGRVLWSLSEFTAFCIYPGLGLEPNRSCF